MVKQLVTASKAIGHEEQIVYMADGEVLYGDWTEINSSRNS